MKQPFAKRNKWHTGTRLLLCASITLWLSAFARAQPSTRHPGNVFVSGERVSIPARGSNAWELLDYDDRVLRSTTPVRGTFDLGPLPVGWYRLRSAEKSNDWISLAVLESLPPRTSAHSPISIDVAMSWFFPTNTMRDAANLCALAGVNWVRDRLSWPEMEPRRGEFSSPNKYDFAARIQAEAGLRILQVNHISPKWANTSSKRFPEDLRDVYNFHREMASRWRGQVLAIEPWNEADIVAFGGHTGAEMASFQKAAYLGLKAGNSNVIASLNVWASHRRAQLADFAANEPGAYFDTYNLHHYEAIERYPLLYADHRAISTGKPMWVSEFAVPVKWTGDEKLKEPSDADLRTQSERLVKAFAASLFEGSQNSFYFMFPHYVEGQTQFGIVRPDLTPRPAYVALAAVARRMADAKPIGRLSTNGLSCYFFTSRTGEMAIAWSATNAALPSALASAPAFDHLGREHKNDHVTSQPRFISIPAGTSKQFALDAPPPTPARTEAQRSVVVLQVVWPAESAVLARSASRVASDKPETLHVFAYNFGPRSVAAACRVSAPSGWKVRFPERVEIPPAGRVEIPLVVDLRGTTSRLVETLRMELTSTTTAPAVLSFGVMPEPHRLRAQKIQPVSIATNAAAWITTISGSGLAKLSAANAEVICEAEPRGNDRWFYPRIELPAHARPQRGAEAVSFTFRLIEGEGTFRALFDEANGSGYVIHWMIQPKPGEAIEAVAFFDDAEFGHAWSKPDPNHHFDPEQAVALKIGCNTKSDRVKFAISNVRWVKF